jgi:alpha-beta hydrolase superfamily lysophospholipase
MIERFARFPAALAERSKTARLAGVPALLSHPDWKTPAPTAIWMHGRTVSKELDPGRYLRWIRAGVAACALDLPGHGERTVQGHDTPERTLDVVAQMVLEIDGVVAALGAPEYRGFFDSARMALGGMSAGGMAALRRLCDPHPFVCAMVESTTGDLGALYHPDAARPWPVKHSRERIAPLDPSRHLDAWRPIPLLVLHSEADRSVPFAGMRGFVERLRERYRSLGADPAMIELVTWPQTGAPDEHSGFGRFSNDAKNAQTAFLGKHLHATPAGF